MRTVNYSEKDIRKVVEVVIQLTEGRSFAAGQVELTANAASTTVSLGIIPAGCFPQLTPASSAAAAEWGAGTIYVSAVANGSFTITHANAATTGRMVNWNAAGG